MVDIVIGRAACGIVYGRRVRTEEDRRRGIEHPRIIWARRDEIDFEPEAGEIIGISERDYENCEVA